MAKDTRMSERICDIVCDYECDNVSEGHRIINASSRKDFCVLSFMKGFTSLDEQ
jgi:hypothetical protein